MKKFYAAFFAGALSILLLCDVCIYLPASSWLKTIFAALYQVAGLLQILSIPGLMVLLPITGIWILFRILGVLKKRFKLVEHGLTILLGLCIVAFLTLFLSAHSFHTEYLRSRAANRAILRAEPLIQAIEAYHSEVGAYPSGADELIPNQLNALPTSGSAGTSSYSYELNGDAYDVSFRQCTFFICWNPLIYIYNPQDNQQGYGEFPTLKETGYPHWRYFYFD